MIEMKKENILISINEACKKTGRSRQYIYQLIKDGKIKKHTENGVLRVDFLELYSYISTGHYEKVGRPRKKAK
jgi:excisionase family DNA binding protein